MMDIKMLELRAAVADIIERCLDTDPFDPAGGMPEEIAREILSHFEPVELEAIDDEALLEMVKYIQNKITLCSAVIKATIQHNQKGQLYRIREVQR